jgi:nitrite reductase (NADH) large subunit
MEFFEQRGCPLKTERGNRVFPVSDKAQSVLDALRHEMRRNGVTVRTGRVKEILMGNGAVCGVATEKEIFDGKSVILATGGKAFLPPIPGIERDNVFALRTYDDLIRLRKKIAAGAEKFTIVGGGILGLELADALLKCNVAVTLLERSERLLKKDVSPEDSQMMMEKLQTVENFKLICSASTCEVTDKGVLLESGEVISSDVVIFSTGSRPELSGISSEITVDRGIVVNSRMESNIPDVYACGDNSQYDGNVCGLYTTSRAMAAVAGNNAAGNLTEYVPKHNSITLNVLGFKMSSDGKVTVK